MLDIDASFAPVPEFQTTRLLVAERALLSHDRLQGVEFMTSAVIPAIAVPECAKGAPSVKRLAEPGEFARADAAEISQALGFATLFAEPPTEALPRPQIALTAFAPDEAGDDLAFDETFAADPLDTASFVPDLAQDTALAEARPVTPRRPMRFTFAREAGEASPVMLPVPNLFDGIFHEDLLEQPDIDPRLRRSRERALSRLAAFEAALPPEQRNLWADDGEDPVVAVVEEQPTPVQHLADTDPHPMAEAGQPRRIVRHLTPRRRDEQRLARPAAAVHDPLQDHLHRVRDALYIADPAEEPVVEPEPALHHRLMAILMHVFLLLSTLPDRLADLVPAPRRGFALRLASAASLATAVVTVVLHKGPTPPL